MTSNAKQTGGHGHGNSAAKSQMSKAQKDHIEKIWGRARANAFAHRDATELLSSFSLVMFLYQCLCGLTSLFIVIVLYALISKDSWISTGATPLYLTMASLIFSIIGLIISVMQNYVRFEERSANHRHNHHSFLYLAQRSREIDSPGIDELTGQALIDDLERDFQILKVRGQEPNDRNFRVGHTFLKGIGESQFGKLQSNNLSEMKDGVAKKDVDEDTQDSESRDDLLDRVKANKISWYERRIRGIVWLICSSLYVGSLIATYQVGLAYYAEDKANHDKKLALERLHTEAARSETSNDGDVQPPKASPSP